MSNVLRTVPGAELLLLFLLLVVVVVVHLDKRSKYARVLSIYLRVTGVYMILIFLKFLYLKSWIYIPSYTKKLLKL